MINTSFAFGLVRHFMRRLSHCTTRSKRACELYDAYHILSEFCSTSSPPPVFPSFSMDGWMDSVYLNTISLTSKAKKLVGPCMR